MNKIAPLKHYFDVLKGLDLPFFMHLKEIECERCTSIKEMWEEHKRAMLIYREMKKNKEHRKNEVLYSLLDLKYDIAREILKSCVFCERKCGVNRTEGKIGWCKVGANSRVASMFEHYGEESILVPSGTIFFSGCNWRCVYCQNWDISQFPENGILMSGKEIAEWINEKTSNRKIINANFVGGEPTPHLHTIIDCIRNIKAPIPIIWNSNMYMSKETMELLEGLVDVYLADFRYGNDECAKRLSMVPYYMKVMDRNFKKASNDAEIIIRILVLPNHIECCTKNILKWISNNIADKVYVNLMSQYIPYYKAMEYCDIARSLQKEEFASAIDILLKNKIKYYEMQKG